MVTKEYLDSCLDVRFAEQQAYVDNRFAEQDAHFKVVYWMLGIILVATVVLSLQGLMGL